MAEQIARAPHPDMDATSRSAGEVCSLPLHASSLHDLAGPVNQVSAILELFERKYQRTLDGEAQALLGMIRTSANRLQNLWFGIQTYAGTVGSPQGHRRYDAVALLNAASELSAASIRDSDARITHEPLPEVMCDPNQISCVFKGLIENAIKFRSASRPEIHVSAVRMENRWRFSFRDNGIGVEPKNAELVFHLFKRLNGDRYPGAGAGLAIAKRIVEEHGGRIWLESEPERGAEFFLTLRPADG